MVSSDGEIVLGGGCPQDQVADTEELINGGEDPDRPSGASR